MLAAWSNTKYTVVLQCFLIYTHSIKVHWYHWSLWEFWHELLEGLRLQMKSISGLDAHFKNRLSDFPISIFFPRKSRSLSFMTRINVTIHCGGLFFFQLWSTHIPYHILSTAVSRWKTVVMLLPSRHHCEIKYFSYIICKNKVKNKAGFWF